MTPFDTTRRDALDAAIAIAKINNEETSVAEIVTDAKTILDFLVPPVGVST